MTQEALKYLQTGAIVPVDMETTRILVNALKEALAQPEQEPVAKVTSETGDPDITMSWWHEPALPVGTPLYTTPPQRTWVGLTDDEQQQAYEQCQNEGWGVFYNAIEAKLKQKNG